jgi:hypothetical protein
VEVRYRLSARRSSLNELRLDRQAQKSAAYDVWQDRAVFHFLTSPSDRVAYVRQVARAVKPGHHVIVSTFGPEGPMPVGARLPSSQRRR